MHTSESLDPVVSRLKEIAQELGGWADQLRDGVNLLRVLQDLILNEEMTPDNLERCLSLFRVLFTTTDSAMEELRCMHGLVERFNR